MPNLMPLGQSAAGQCRQVIENNNTEVDKDVRIGFKIGQIDPNWNNSGLFTDLSS